MMGVFLLVAGVLGAQPQGRVEVEAEDGVLAGVETRWSPSSGWEGRWWHREGGGGSAWVRGPGFQVGPLVLSASTEGKKSWGPGTDLASGAWGLGLDLGPVGLWAAQTSERFEAGLQAEGDLGPWCLAAGGDRTWDLGLPTSDLGPWVDQARGGLRYRSEGGDGGIEATVIVPSWGPGGWDTRARMALDAGPWTFWGRTHLFDDPTRPQACPWSWKGGVDRGPYRVSWEASAEDAAGKGEVGWHSGGPGGAVTWGPSAGAGVKARWEGLWGSLGFRGTGEVALVPGGWNSSVGARVSAPWDPGRASLAWSVAPGAEAPVQTLEATWSHPTFSASARWKVEGLRLGWVGPGSSFRLSLTWVF